MASEQNDSEESVRAMRPGVADAERRKEMRYPAEAAALVYREGRETIQAMAVNISSAGMRLCMENCPLQVDEAVSVEVQLPDQPDKPFSSWGIGRVAYVDAMGAGIQLFGGEFASAR